MAGATIGELVPGYHPRDTANLGYGVMICYELHSSDRSTASSAFTKADGNDAPRAVPHSVPECEKLVRDVFAALSYSSTDESKWESKRLMGFMDLGIDSLDAVVFVQKLNAHFSLNMSQTITFEYPTIKEVRGQSSFLCR